MMKKSPRRLSLNGLRRDDKEQGNEIITNFWVTDAQLEAVKVMVRVIFYVSLSDVCFCPF